MNPMAYIVYIKTFYSLKYLNLKFERVMFIYVMQNIVLSFTLIFSMTSRILKRFIY